jgi:tetratricopeptide (TPR) repeat protein
MKFFSRFIFLSAALVCSPLVADVLHLKDGTSLNGALKHTDDGWTVTKDGKSLHVLSEQVESIELTANTTATPKAAMERLESLRRSVDSLSDLNDIVARFQRFVDQNTDPLSTTDARKDLAVWQDRLNQKMVKVGSTWVTAAERAKRVEQAAINAETARQLMKQGRTIEAEPILVDTTAVDPTNATALYLLGLLRYQQDQVPAARRALEATAAVVPNHSPTLNNLAIVLWRQKQFAAAMTDFDGAILATPMDKLLLDNVAVALQTLPPDFQKNQIALKLVRHFNEQDQQLAQLMAQQGLRRYGSIWVSERDILRWKAEEKAIQDKLDTLASDFDHSRQRIDQLTQLISDNTAQIHRIESTSYMVDPRTGAQTQMPYPQAYYDLLRDNQNAQRDRDSEVGKLDQLKKQAVDLQSSRPGAKNQGVMRMVGPEGTPIRVVMPAVPLVGTPPAATQP